MTACPLLVTGAARLGAAELDSLPRPRRMDTFAWAGCAAASRALAEAGYAKRPSVDARTGVVAATALGCRASVAEHQRTLSRAVRLDDLSPAVFARTVHNTVAGELALEWRLGGASETLTSGATAGVDALLLARDLLSRGALDRLVVAGAEGLSEDVTRAARLSRGEAAAPPEGCGAALVLERPDPTRGTTGRALLLGGKGLFAADAAEAAEGLANALRLLDPDPSRLPLVLASPGDDGGLSPAGLARAGLRGPVLESAPADLLGASAVWGAVGAVAALRNGLAGRVAVLVRDPEGPAGVVLLGAPVSAGDAPR